MRSLGWHPLRAATFDWPSGLALGPYGRLLSAAFVLCGLALPVFAAGLAAALDGGRSRSARAGTALLSASGAAMILLASDTDPTLAQEPPTLHGRLHDAAFALLGLTLLPALTLLACAMRGDPRWRSHGYYTLYTALLAVVCFLLRGAAFYLFLAAALGWFAATALRLQSR